MDDGTALPAGLDGLAPDELGAWRGLIQVHAELVRELDAELVAAHGLPLSSYEVLLSLERAPDRRLRMAELADGVRLSRSGMTRLVDRLERDGLLERDGCPDDARGRYAVLTDKGAEVLRQASATHVAGVRRRFLGHFEASELRVLSEWWRRLVPERTDLSPGD